jgi:AcrR family transcriptional regulator
MQERTGQGDPRRTVALLWRGDEPRAARRGPRPRLDVLAVTAAAVALADADGLGAVTMRELAVRLGLASPTALYTYIPGKAELIDLMVDRCFAEFALDPGSAPADVRSRVLAVADANRVLVRRHLWLADVAVDRPPLGPGQLHKYELELTALDGLGLGDHEMEYALTIVTTFVRAHVAATAAAGSDAAEAAWWAEAGPELARHADPADYPLGNRVGSAVGAEQGRALDPDAAYAFGVERIAAGIAVLAGERRTA